jgi:hypothetical protein
MTNGPIFPTRRVPERVPANPEQLFGMLPRKRDGIGPLWSHQADQLREYYESHVESPDVALELPTGSGKTLVGLLIAEWRRRARSERVVYACPTKQLARQVAAAASERVGAVLLIGKSRGWDQRDLVSYTRAQAVAVTTYSAIFNSNSRFADAQTIVFDDAHAAENYVADAWAVRIPRNSNAYSDMFDAFGNSIDSALVDKMNGPAAESDVRLIPLSAVSSRIADLRSVLSTGLDAANSFSYSMIADSLETCLFYVARDSWYIRPLIPPTFQHTPFTNANQRLYLSATLGNAGELERAFGRRSIARVPVPPVWERSGAGRRFIVFPQLADREEEPHEHILKQIASISPKSLILTPDRANADEMAAFLEVPEADQYHAENDDGVEQFLAADRGALLSPSRYDGMDLAGEKCRLEIMAKAPEMSHLQDRFISTKLGAQVVLQERTRTRITQGLGRATRGTDDWSVVVVWGEDLIRYFSNKGNTQGMPVELQAEIEYGLEASQTSISNLVELSLSAYAQDHHWLHGAEPVISDYKADSAKIITPLAQQLSDVSVLEVRAWEEAWALDWASAAEKAVTVLEQYTSPAARPYRALWAYLASAWFRRAAAQNENQAHLERSRALLSQATNAAGPNTWLRDVIAATGAQRLLLTPADQDAVSTIIARVNKDWTSSSRFAATTQGMVAGLAQHEAKAYEQAAVTLGVLLGAQSSKPAGKGRCDAAWIWPKLWIAVEAKSEQTAEMLSMDYVRKANTQLASLASDLGADVPPNSLSVIVGTTELIDPDAVPIASESLCLALHREVLDIAQETSRTLTQVRSTVTGIDTEHAAETVGRLLFNARLLPSQIRERLSARRIRG